ncbi:Uncharacterised protein [Paucimonas lemoignei]|nr:Uncharacterised protein [Paucimonas lemoignei]
MNSLPQGHAFFQVHPGPGADRGYEGCEGGVSDRRCSQPSAAPTNDHRSRGSEFIREEALTSDVHLSSAPQPSRMNSLPQGHAFFQVHPGPGADRGYEGCEGGVSDRRWSQPSAAPTNDHRPRGSEFIREEALTSDVHLSSAPQPSRMNSLPQGHAFFQVHPVLEMTEVTRAAKAV